MLANENLPKFGPLQGIKVLHADQVLAGPHCAQLFADFGADVIWAENAVTPDLSRFAGTMSAPQERRNQRTIALNIPTPEGEEIFFKLIKEVDIFIEAAKGGQYEKWGLTDERLWEVNPQLVIIHISGFGQTGIEKYIKRPSFDALAQAFSGYMSVNGFVDRPPIAAQPFTGDYMTGVYAAFAGMAAVYRAKTTGEGESIDIAQYEVLLRAQYWATDYLTRGKIYGRQGNHHTDFAAVGLFTCQDGEHVYVFWMGAGTLKKGLPLLGLEYGSDLIPEGTGSIRLGTPAGDIVEERLKAFCLSKPASEVEDILLEAGIPCSKIMDYQSLSEDPHVQIREVFTEWEDNEGNVIKGVNVVPKFKNNPGRTWRAMPDIGMDNEEILSELGYSDKDINRFYEKRTIKKSQEEKKQKS
ncbi:L-carnitine CoA-transferase [Bacillus sp. EB600]|uniref:L-carnitine CoA-transferase n=1 Tax=Bacillus sp. EB600 TaxID=2806345 RepID=UPI00210B8360|nr:L-carnitine CoA-transferase [Bacillus sp. EB600]MCQ6279583.1 L-carnitine CoA-transferase [Bacillus sp. EB600]